MQINDLSSWGEEFKKPLMMAGPCSAETEEQLYETSKALKEQNINIIRAGIWKPRTRPNNFEGIGPEALKWIQQIKKELDVKFAIEIASPHHVFEALKHGIDIFWIGARSTANPFTVQEIADALKGLDIPVFIKNPVNPDLSLWLGAIERIYNAGIRRIGAIHRGFSSFKNTKYRNIPMWQIPLELKSKMPSLPMICDPSHIAGNRQTIYEVSQRAMDLDYDGLIIESHRDPDNAWSDARQQVAPQQLKEIMDKLNIRQATSENQEFINHLEELREQIDEVDREIYEAMAARMRIVDKIGYYKKANNVTVFQVNRWKEISESRSHWAETLNLNKDFMADLYKMIHDASIRRQTDIINQNSETKSKPEKTTE
ncbi:MAG: chorismate mutase [Candidatus Cyclobacteriaceae bacterium M3_2C_046]